MSEHFTKHYTEPERTAAAVRHYRWLAEHAEPLKQPALQVIGPLSLTFERIEGRPVRPDDFPRVAAMLGDAHGSAWSSDLASATLHTPHRFQDGTVFADYVELRRTALQRRFEQGYLPSRTALRAMLDLLEKTASGPCAFYKDSNPRNFIITAAGEIVTVDTDDLSLAPVGYDLAKLTATLQLTYGPLTSEAIDTACDAYNQGLRQHGPRLDTTDRERLDDCLALHAILTAPYLGRNGYRHGWPAHIRLRLQGAS
ncbi:phosphotransferase [Streptomyces sp. NPDC048641]|uniref:phosphotransferase n=1 Tax=Streptomyces sp. NPDC048641 TaxID=3154825 RepID=UPI00343AC1C9